MGNQFLIRVYGVLINENDEILLSDEKFRGKTFTKFPGGGLEYGEGMIDCLVREFKEEADIEIKVGELLYLTDFFEASSFEPNNQVVSVYYFVTSNEVDKIKVSTIKNDFKTELDKEESFRWKKINELTAEDVTFRTEKRAIEALHKLRVSAFDK